MQTHPFYPPSSDDSDFLGIFCYNTGYGGVLVSTWNTNQTLRVGYASNPVTILANVIVANDANARGTAVKAA